MEWWRGSGSLSGEREGGRARARREGKGVKRGEGGGGRREGGVREGRE